MKITILYPADYFDIKKVDADYRQEYEEAVKFPEFQAVLYNYDNFVAGEPFRLYPAEAAGDDERCIYRGWMLQPEVYARLFEALKERKLTLINTPAEYENCMNSRWLIRRLRIILRESEYIRKGRRSTGEKLNTHFPVL